MVGITCFAPCSNLGGVLMLLRVRMETTYFNKRVLGKINHTQERTEAKAIARHFRRVNY